VNKGFLKAGHQPTLLAAFLYFDVSFMVWVLLGPLGVAISHDLHLSPAQKGLMVAVPVLAGALLRVLLGALVDRFRAKRTAIGAQIVVILGLAVFWATAPQTLPALFALGLVLGLAGASFAAALPLASGWYPPEYQGTALGIAGAGNSGTVLAALFAPALAIHFGWHNVIGLAVVPLSVVLLLFVLLAKDSPSAPAPKRWSAYLDLLRQADAWRFMAFYAVTFGGFVGLAASLTIYFSDQYGLSAVVAGNCTAAVVFTGSLVRPLGGMVADRVGGVRALTVLYAVAAVAFAAVGVGLSTIWIALPVFVAGMFALGMGNGAVFQLVPQRFGGQIGAITGLVGMAGGVGGFLLASGLGTARQYAGSYGAGFGVFAFLAVAALATLLLAGRKWGRNTSALPHPVHV
jgi:NNP family nitrate/nitrite transporter-like MFS transporter